MQPLSLTLDIKRILGVSTTAFSMKPQAIHHGTASVNGEESEWLENYHHQFSHGARSSFEMHRRVMIIIHDPPGTHR